MKCCFRWRCSSMNVTSFFVLWAERLSKFYRRVLSGLVVRLAPTSLCFLLFFPGSHCVLLRYPKRYPRERCRYYAGYVA
jgi:hypothetical protein